MALERSTLHGTSASEKETTVSKTDDARKTHSLPSTAHRVQQIQTDLASSIRAEFASVTERLNTSQRNPKTPG